jgi:hypothetical protein
MNKTCSFPLVNNVSVNDMWENSVDAPDFPRIVMTWELEKIESNKTSLKLVH